MVSVAAGCDWLEGWAGDVPGVEGMAWDEGGAGGGAVMERMVCVSR